MIPRILNSHETSYMKTADEVWSYYESKYPIIVHKGGGLVPLFTETKNPIQGEWPSNEMKKLAKNKFYKFWEKYEYESPGTWVIDFRPTDFKYNCSNIFIITFSKGTKCGSQIVLYSDGKHILDCDKHGFKELRK